MAYLYDESGIIGCVHTVNNTTTNVYYYRRNLQGDVVGIYDTNGNLVTEYVYDAYGNCTIKQGANNEISRINPIRYRGYYLDRETNLYYLNARYYNPEWRRFISPDDSAYLDPETPNGLNLYCYCGNDPVNFVDPSGHEAEWVGTALKIMLGVAVIVGCAAASIGTFGLTSVLFAGAAIGALAGGVGAGISTYLSGGDVHDFANSFLLGTTTGAISGAVAASPLGIGWQMGINAGLGVANYVGTQLIGNNSITLGGVVFSGLTGLLCGYLGQSGWTYETSKFIQAVFYGNNALKNVISIAGAESLIRIVVPALTVGGIGGGVYGRINEFFNPNGYFVGI